MDKPTNSSDKKPSPRQILGAKIRAERERFEEKHRKPYAGGFIMPPSKDVYAHLAKMFDIPIEEVSYFMTFTRYCTHPWSAGACAECPE